MTERLPALASSPRVAIVDDHHDMRQLLALRLAMAGALDVAGQAANGSQAVELARRLQPDVMTLDLHMPVMGGAEAIPLLRAAAPRMRIVVFSSDPMHNTLTGEHRPDAVVTKSSRIADLVAIILGLLAERREAGVEVDLADTRLVEALPG